MTGQLSLTITELLIQCTPAPRPTSNDDATAVTPAQKHQPAFGNQQVAIHMSPEAPPALPLPGPSVPVWRTAVRPRTGGPQRGVPRWGGLLMSLFPAHRSTSGG